jgi:hypothetical protein
LLHLRKNSAGTPAAAAKVEAAQVAFEAQQARFAHLREALATKLALLESNKVSELAISAVSRPFLCRC